MLYGSMAFLPDILLLTQGTIAVWFDGILSHILYYNLFSYVTVLPSFVFVVSDGLAWRLICKCII